MSTLIAAAASLLVFCAPGYPGTSADAQPLVGEFATTLAAAAGWPAGSLTAVYDASEQERSCAARGARGRAGLRALPILVQHGAQLHMVPLVQADVPPAGLQQRWTLVLQKGHAAAAGGTGGPHHHQHRRLRAELRPRVPCTTWARCPPTPPLPPPARCYRRCAVRPTATRSRCCSTRSRPMPSPACRSPRILQTVRRLRHPCRSH